MTAAPARDRSGGPSASGRGPSRRRGEAELLARVTTLRQAVLDVVGIDPVTSDLGSDDRRAADTVAALTNCCIQRLRSLGESDGSTAELLSRLIVDLQQLGIDVYQHDLGDRTRRVAECSAGLARLRALPSSADLLDQVCEELVRRCGFGRAVLSRVENGIWKPWLAFFSDGAEFDQWFVEWINQGIPLDDLAPEARLLTERRPAVVYDTDSTPVYRPIIVDSGQSKSYVVAPVMRGNDVVGFMHADHHPSARRVDDVDRDLLWAFAEGFGHIYERIVLLERLRAQRDQVRGILSSTVRMMSVLVDSGIDLERADDDSAGPRNRTVSAERLVPAAFGELTAREAEVLQLMIGGATNGAIAEQLVITEDTVKSHVKRILRKLGAVNRSQAIARSLGLAPRDTR